uniref:Uncharacterized protein n=1 Tax=Anguilla anguilla TaxID=7936 RepID=A0A0E9PH98_ANGAN
MSLNTASISITLITACTVLLHKHSLYRLPFISHLIVGVIKCNN